jgi:hypothetical protein
MKRPRLLISAAVATLLALAWLAWSPGRDRRDGRHDRGRNGLWLGHGWLGDDGWFTRNQKQSQLTRFRDPARIADLARRMRAHHVTDLFPHLCPTALDGRIAPEDPVQAERLLDGLAGFRVLPWVGGARGVQAFPAEPSWRANFARSIGALLRAHPRLAGVQVNVEPWPSGDPDGLRLLDEVRAALPAGRILSVAAYPPPTRWHPYPEVHWDQGYYREVSRRVDQLVPMLYDTSLRVAKPYRWLMATWTRQVLAWSGATPVLLGLPAYDDAGVGYHDPSVENLPNALQGIHAGLEGPLPRNYQGVALYSEWEMDAGEWQLFRGRFLRR